MKQKIIFSDDNKINHRKQERLVNGFNLSCFASLYYIEILFYHTLNTLEDKKIVFSQFEKLFLLHQCRSNTQNHEKALQLCNLFLENQYISLDDKRKIRNFLKKYQ